MAIFGYNGSDPKLQAVIIQLRSRASKAETTQLRTLAQYEITNVQITPVTYDVRHVNHLQLVLTGRLVGMNNPENRAVMMNSAQEIHDTLPIDKDTYSLMVKGGLYDNPIGYERSLAQKLVSRQYYRSTQASFESLLIKDRTNLISIGDFAPNQAHYTRIFIGHDLALSRDLSAEPKTNIHASLTPALYDLAAHPVKEDAKIATIAQAREESRQLGVGADYQNQAGNQLNAPSPKSLSAMRVNQELDLNSASNNNFQEVQSATESSASASIRKRSNAASEVSATSSSVAIPKLKKVQVSSELSLSSVDNVDLNGLLAQLQSTADQTTTPGKPKSYRDDFADALQQQNDEARQKNNQKRARNERHEVQQQEHDDGLSF